MKYLGSKRRIAKRILPIILKNRTKNQWYVEPFCGGCNVIDKVPVVDGYRLASDNNYYLIECCKAIAEGWLPQQDISETLYNDIKNNVENYPPYLVGYVAFQLSFGAKWFGGYRRDKIGKRNYSREAFRNVKRQQPYLKNIHFVCSDYKNLEIYRNSIVYCDPPYANSTKYKDDFDHERYWRWVRDLVADGHRVFCSEYTAPKDFVSIWSKELITGVDVCSRKIDVENLFIHISQLKSLTSGD